jgi:hypothetical protein
MKLALLTIALYFALQAIVVVLHEHAHSTAAWLLGYTRTPFTVIWGNPLTIQGWDEGVPYDQLFPSAGHAAEAVIGGAPLLMHAVFVALGFYLLRCLSTSWKLTFYATYLFVVVNLTELVAYILMRPFAGSGDTGRFNEGFRLSPWLLFLAGTVLLCLALGLLLRRMTPKLDRVMEWTGTEHSVVVSFTAFVMFLWGSGLRIMALYPDRQWKWGLLGFAGFATWLLLSPRYVQDR